MKFSTDIPKIRLQRLFWYILILMILSVLSYLFFDVDIAKNFYAKSAVSKKILKGMCFVITPPLQLILWPAAYLICLIIKKRKYMYITLLLSFSLWFGTFFARILKYSVGRARPSYFLQDPSKSFKPLSITPHFDAMPSGHAVIAFAIAGVASLFFPKGRIFYLLLAFIFSFTRVLLRKHFLSDILMGGCIGLVAVILSYFLLNKLNFLYEKEFKTE